MVLIHVLADELWQEQWVMRSSGIGSDGRVVQFGETEFGAIVCTDL